MPCPLLVFCGSTPDKAIHYFHIDHNIIMHLVYPPTALPPKFCINIVLDFSWDNCYIQEKLETMVMQNLGGGGAGNKKHYGLCESSELKIGQEV